MAESKAWQSWLGAASIQAAASILISGVVTLGTSAVSEVRLNAPAFALVLFILDLGRLPHLSSAFQMKSAERSEYRRIKRRFSSYAKASPSARTVPQDFFEWAAVLALMVRRGLLRSWTIVVILTLIFRASDPRSPQNMLVIWAAMALVEMVSLMMREHALGVLRMDVRPIPECLEHMRRSVPYDYEDPDPDAS